MKYLACLMSLSLIFFPFIEGNGQVAKTDQVLSVSFSNSSLLDIVEKLEERSGCKIYLAYSDSSFSPLTASFQEQSVEQILSTILKNSPMSFISYDQQLIVIGKQSSIELSSTAQAYQSLEENIEILNDPTSDREVIGKLEEISSEGTARLAGKVRDQETGKFIAGASILIKPEERGVSTDKEGSYTLELEPGSYDLHVQYIGYKKRIIPIHVISSGNLDISLIKGDIQLDEIVLEAYASEGNVESNQTGLVRIDIKRNRETPQLFRRSRCREKPLIATRSIFDRGGK